MRHKRKPLIILTLLAALTATALAGRGDTSRDYTTLLRRKVLTKVDALEPAMRPTPVMFQEKKLGRYPWKFGIVTTVFWIGETPTANNPTPNHKSSWDKQWARNYGGFDNPNPRYRRGFLPARFIPRQNPFYVALPYNDITRNGTKPEAYRVIPWFWQTFERPGRTVLKSRWLAIRKGNRVAYAQWEDCGPFRTDHWQYVFGNERPRRNLNRGAGLDVSPAVRDYLGMSGTDVTDWKFVEFNEVPVGPWSMYGENNTFVQNRRKRAEALVNIGDVFNSRPVLKE
ncbi:MAG TPA: hypothetical protein VIT91_04750 [Chthoniobacterales bacterium]